MTTHTEVLLASIVVLRCCSEVCSKHRLSSNVRRHSCNVFCTAMSQPLRNDRFTSSPAYHTHTHTHTHIQTQSRAPARVDRGDSNGSCIISDVAITPTCGIISRHALRHLERHFVGVVYELEIDAFLSSFVKGIIAYKMTFRMT